MVNIPYPTYSLSPELLTTQHFAYLPVSPISFSALVFALTAISYLAIFDYFRRFVLALRTDVYLSHHKPIQVDDFAAYAADFQTLDLNHVSRVLRLSIKSSDQPLPVLSATNRIVPTSIRTHWEVPAVSSSQPEEPPVLRLVFEAYVTTGGRDVLCHIFTRVPVNRIQSFLRMVSKPDEGGTSVHASNQSSRIKSALRRCRNRMVEWYTNAWPSSPPTPVASADPTASLLDTPLRLELASTPPSDPLSASAYAYLAAAGVAQSFKIAPTGGELVQQEARFMFPWGDSGFLENSNEVELVLLLVGHGQSQASQLILCNGRQGNGSYQFHKDLMIIKDPPSIITQKAVFGLSDPHERDCLVCLSSPKTTILLPCRHSVACRDCLSGLFQDRCLLCRAHFQGWVELNWAEDQTAASPPPTRANDQLGNSSS